jgi:hypothetical protein
MRICIYGAGAIGRHLAMRLSRVGADVSVLARGPHLEVIKRAVTSIQLSACLLLVVNGPIRAENTKLRVNVFAEAQNLALFVAQDKGMFAQRQLDVEVTFTPTSGAQREGLVNGSFDIAQAGVDNAVALVQTAPAARGDRCGWRQRWQPPVCAARNSLLSGSARQGCGGGCAQYRLRVPRLQDVGAEGSA